METQQPSLQLKEKIAAPMMQVLEGVVPSQAPSYHPNQSTQTLKNSLDDLFPEQRYMEKDMRRSKEILAGLSDAFTPEQLNDEIAKVKYLCEHWLDDFEKQIFKGSTLKELLNEKG